MLDKGGPPLGLFSATQYVSGHTVLQEGDVLVLYTDGLLDAPNAEEVQFGEERLRAAVRASLSRSSAEICRNVIDRLTGGSHFVNGMKVYECRQSDES